MFVTYYQFNEVIKDLVTLDLNATIKDRWGIIHRFTHSHGYYLVFEREVDKTMFMLKYGDKL